MLNWGTWESKTVTAEIFDKNFQLPVVPGPSNPLFLWYFRTDSKWNFTILKFIIIWFLHNRSTHLTAMNIALYLFILLFFLLCEQCCAIVLCGNSRIILFPFYTCSGFSLFKVKEFSLRSCSGAFFNITTYFFLIPRHV